VYNEDSYKKAMQRMLPIFEKKGAFRCWTADTNSFRTRSGVEQLILIRLGLDQMLNNWY
jgi:hypothetical protein